MRSLWPSAIIDLAKVSIDGIAWLPIVASMSNPPIIPEETAREIDALTKNLVRELDAFRGGGRSPVSPLGPLQASPILAGAGVAVPATNMPFPTAPPAAAPVVTPPPAPPAVPLKPIWTSPDGKEAPPTERLSSNAIDRIAYEVSVEQDACGGPIWRRAPLPLSPAAEAVLAQHVGTSTAVAVFATVLRTILKAGGSTDYNNALVHNTLEKFGLIDGPWLKPIDVPRAPAAPMRMGAEGVAARIIEVQRQDCTMLVITCDYAPKFGDVVRREPLTDDGPSWEGSVVRVMAKDAGAFDLIVTSQDGKLEPGPITIFRPIPVAPPAPPAVAASEEA